MVPKRRAGIIRREPETLRRKKVAHIIVKIFICGFSISKLDRIGNKKIFGKPTFRESQRAIMHEHMKKK